MRKHIPHKAHRMFCGRCRAITRHRSQGDAFKVGLSTARLDGTIRLRTCETCGESVPTAEVRWSELSELLGEAENARASRVQLQRQLDAIVQANEQLQGGPDELPTTHSEAD